MLVKKGVAMAKRGIITCDDGRYYHTKNFLTSNGYEFHAIYARPINLDFAVFQFSGEIDEGFFTPDYFGALPKKTKIFSGLRSNYLTKVCQKNNLGYYPMMESEDVTKKNAVPTAEGVIHYLIQSRESTIANSQILVIGYGICGKEIATRLNHLGATVYALVRNHKSEVAAKQDGITPIYIDDLDNHNFGAVINTVPAQVLTDDHVKKLSHALLVDIASAPYGFNLALAQTFNKASTILPKIPSKYAIKSSGEILGEFIKNVMEG